MTEDKNVFILNIGFAALIHDIGKIVQQVVKVPEDYKASNEALYQPFHNNHYTHSHALATAYFIEEFGTKCFPKALCVSNSSEKGADTVSLINLASKHHLPDSPEQWIITQADRLSSGIDRDTFSEGPSIPTSDAVKTRLIPLFEMILHDIKDYDSSDSFRWRYALAPMNALTIFPQQKVSDDKGDYKKLYDGFVEDLNKLKHKEAPELWLQHFDSLYRIYTSYVPAARVGHVVHDVSLYDHSRSTASLACALYRYHRETNSLTKEAVNDLSSKKFLLVSGDFYGIQSFIFSAGGEERGYRSKILRGRSFMVSLLTDLAATTLCTQLKLTFLSTVMCAGGKFHIIAHNTEKARKTIQESAEKLNEWLFEKTLGESTIGISFTEAAPEDFLNGRFRHLWKKHMERMEERKFQRIDLRKVGGVVKNYLDRFNNDLFKPLCPFCGRKPSEKQAENDSKVFGPNKKVSACSICRDQILIGASIVKREKVVVLKGEKGDLLVPLFGRYQMSFGHYGNDPKSIEKFWDINVEKDGTIPREVTFMPLNGYVPLYEEKEDLYDDRILEGPRREELKLELIEMIRDGVPKSFYHIAAKALGYGEDNKLLGIDALGVFKADVDNMGAIFGCGFPEKRYTLSRLATLSRQLNNFFSIYLPYALKTEKNDNFHNIYTVFAGGDDLFLIGPWNVVQKAALFINEAFRNYTCNNQYLHLSGGITLHKPSVPVDIIAEKSEEALHLSKEAGRDRITIFNRTVKWQDFKELTETIQDEMEKSWLKDDILSVSEFYRLCTFVDMARREKRFTEAIQNAVKKGGKLRDIYDIESFKWRALLKYHICRNGAKSLKSPEKERRQEDVIEKFVRWVEKYGEALIIPLWNILYGIRRFKK